jgi:hypothetical protein
MRRVLACLPLCAAPAPLRGMGCNPMSPASCALCPPLPGATHAEALAVPAAGRVALATRTAEVPLRALEDKPAAGAESGPPCADCAVCGPVCPPAQGIVTRMGQDPHAGLGGEAIEPGPEGMRPASCAPCWGACGVCDCGADTGAGRAHGQRSAGARAGAGQAQALPAGNHGENLQ